MISKLLIDAGVSGIVGYWLHKLTSINYRKRWLEARDLVPHSNRQIHWNIPSEVSAIAAIFLVLTVMIVGIIATVNLTAGPPGPQPLKNCGNSGIKQIYTPSTENDWTYTILCNNGYVYDH